VEFGELAGFAALPRIVALVAGPIPVEEPADFAALPRLVVPVAGPSLVEESEEPVAEHSSLVVLAAGPIPA
jgi:hypothetical protein